MQVVDRNGRLKVEITSTVDDLSVGVTTISGGTNGRVLYDNAGILGEIAGTSSQYIAGDGSLITFPSTTGFVPYTGATGNVDLGEYELKAGQFTLDTSPTGTSVVGTTQWNNTIGSSQTTLKGGTVILKNGVDLVARVVNKVTPNTTLTRANYTAVRVSGAQGQRLAVAYAQANNDNNSADTIGLVIETIATNQEGFIMTVGQLDDVNTTGSLQGETWVDGDVLYLSPTTAGLLTNIKPTGLTGHIVIMGYVEYAHAVHGKIYVKIMNGWELDELHNVYINPATIANNNILQYDSADQLWKNKTLSTGITIGTTAITSGTVGRVLFEGTGNVVQESANLFWDNTNNRLYISAPFTGSITTRSLYWQADSGLATTGSRSLITIGLDNPRTSGMGVISLGNNSYEQGLTFHTASGGTGQVSNPSGSEAMRITNARNVLINTTTDAGFKLDVNGTARVSGQLTTSVNQNNPTRISITNTTPGTLAGTEILLNTNSSALMAAGKVSNAYTPYKTLAAGDGYLYNTTFGDISLLNDFATGKIKLTAGASSTAQMTLFSTGNFAINTTTDAGFKLDVNGTARFVNDVSFNGSAKFGDGTARITGAQIGGQGANNGVNTLINNGADWVDDTNVSALAIRYNQGVRIPNTTRYPLTIGSNAKATASAQIEMVSTTQGFLPPRMTTTQKNAIASPATGLMVYDTTLNVITYYNGTTWI